MIKIIVVTESKTKKITLLEVKGHAYSGEPGHDLVCAAVSAVVIGGINALEDLGNYQFIHDSGHVLIETHHETDEHDSVVLETILTMLTAIEESSSNYVRIQRKEEN